MAFFSRRKKKGEAERPKKKWQIESSSEEDDGPTTGSSAESLDCVSCQGESDLFCLSCAKYFCLLHFAKTHPLTEAGEDSEMSRHTCRILAGVDEASIETLEVGHIQGQDLSQLERGKQREETQRKRKRAREEEAEVIKKKRKEAAEEEENRLQEEQDKETKAAEDAAAAAAAGAGARASVPAADSAVPTPAEQPRLVFVANLAFEATISDIRTLFSSRAGRIIDITCPKAGPAAHVHALKQKATHHGMAHIEFDTPEDALKAVALDKTLFFNRPIRVTMPSVQAANATAQAASMRAVPFKVRMCQYFLNGTCYRGSDCNYAHHPRELPGGGAEVQIPARMLASAAGKSAPDGGYKW